jgi:hypothetical protein
MPDFLKQYGTEGPLGFPLPDKQARTLDTLLTALPRAKEYEYRKAVSPRAPTELNPGERSDVSWITAESVDRAGEVVVARGMNDSQFQGNPLVTLGHCYTLPPVGKSLWRKRVKDGDLAGIKAKTQYPSRPDNWPAGDPWPSDRVFSLVQAGLLNGKSIGFLPTKVHFADAKEARKNAWPEGTLIIDEWLLLEYACVFLPCNQDALVESVSKGSVDVPDELLRALGLDPVTVKNGRPTAARELPGGAVPGSANVIPFTTLDAVEAAVQRHLGRIDWGGLAARAVQEGYDRARGRV